MTPTPDAVTLLWGEDAFLLREAALAVFGELHPVEVDAADWQGGELQDLATPSLFGERRALPSTMPVRPRRTRWASSPRTWRPPTPTRRS